MNNNIRIKLSTVTTIICMTVLLTFSLTVYAEIYVVEDTITIYGNGRHVTVKHHDKYASKHKRNSYSIYVNRDNNYIPDMSTADDNASKHPGLQIN